MLIQIIYGLFVAIALASALMVVVARKAIYSALFLVLTMVTIACMFVLMNAQLAAALQIIVYAGAIMVLFLFVIMLLNLGRQPPLSHRSRPVRWLGLVFAFGIALQMGALVFSMKNMLMAMPGGAASITIEQVARLILTDYLYAFEMVSVLLLIAVVGAVVLARRNLVQGVETMIEKPDVE
ncbi:MAG: NADH-quinone oxidoreductase subunit J [Candidatus Sumerlaeia bacterium]